MNDNEITAEWDAYGKCEMEPFVVIYNCSNKNNFGAATEQPNCRFVRKIPEISNYCVCVCGTTMEQ